MIEKIFNRPKIEKFPKGISILRNADYAKCRSKFKKRFVQKNNRLNSFKGKRPKKDSINRNLSNNTNQILSLAVLNYCLFILT